MNHRKPDGFVLLEVMLAVAVLSAGIVVVHSAFSRSLKLARVSRDRFHASLLLEGKAWELEHFGKFVPEPEPIDSELPGTEWKFARNESTEGGYDQCDLTLGWGTTDRRDELILSSLLVQ